MYSVSNKIKKIIFIIYFHIHRIFFRKNKKSLNKPEKVEKILIHQTAKLGDAVCTTPVFREIKEKYPDCYLVVICDSTNQEIYKHNKNIDETINENEASVYKIKKYNFDAAILCNVNFDGAFLLYISDIPYVNIPKVIKGYCPFQTKTYKSMLPYFKITERSFGKYAPQEYLNSLVDLDINSTNTKKELFFSEESDKKIEDILNEKDDDNKIKYIGISLAAGNKIKEWPLGRFVEVSKYLLEKENIKIVLIGSKKDLDYSKVFLQSFSETENKNIIDTIGDFSIDELKAVISKLDLFISVDTGPVYIAEAFDVPTINIIGPVDEREQPPVSDKNIVLYDKNRTEAAIHILNARDYDEKEARRQVEYITPEMVINYIKDLIAL